MTKEVFPTYNVENIADNISLNMQGSTADPLEIGLDMITLQIDKSLLEDSRVDLEISISKSQVKINGQIVSFQYNRQTKKYDYKVSLDFDDLRSYLKWLAIIKGLHRARFKI